MLVARALWVGRMGGGKRGATCLGWELSLGVFFLRELPRAVGVVRVTESCPESCESCEDEPVIPGKNWFERERQTDIHLML